MTTTARNAANLPTQVTRPTGAVTTMTYDNGGNLLTTTEQAINATTTFTYEPAFNQVTSITDPKGNRTTIAYDARGNPTQMTDALGQVTTQTYDARGLLTSTQDALGHLTALTYDATGHLVSTTDSLGRITSLGYDAAGNVVASTDALGRVTQFAYDAMNRLTQVTDAAVGVTRYAYDPKGRLVAVTDARGQTTSFAYNAVDQLVQTTNPLGQVKRFQYDLGRNLVLVIDAKGQRLAFGYDAANQLVQKVLTDAAGVVTDVVTLAYDPLGTLASAADADSQLTFTYDALGRLTRVQTGATGAQPASTIGYAYDLSGNRLTMTDPQGGVTTYAYDALNRLTSVTSPDGPTTVAYDALGRRTSLSRPNGTQTTATYDAASQLTDLAHTLGATTLSRVAYTYDPVGNRATRTTPTGVSAYTYDGLSRLTQAQQPNPIDPLQVLTESFAYDPVGNRTASHLAIGQLHDAANRLLEDSAFTSQYDLTGNLTTKTAKATGATTTYAYDVEHRLVAVTGPGLMASYAYDPLGRRIAKTVNGVATRYVYDQEDLLLEYDGAGAPQARYTHGPGIDEPLVRSAVSEVPGLAAGLKAVLASTPDGQGGLVVDNTVVVNGQAFTGFQLVPGFPLPAVGTPIDSTGLLQPVPPIDVTALLTGTSLTVELVDAGVIGGSRDVFLVVLDAQTNRPVRARQLFAAIPTFTSPPTLPVVFASTVVPVTTLVAGQRVFYHADGLGSITELTDGTGAIVQRYRYDAFGALLASPGPVTQPYTFTGREFDAETGLYYYRARFYDPTAGRFVQEDPIGFAGGDTNLYGYVLNDPVNRIDPSGLSAVFINIDRTSQSVTATMGLVSVNGLPIGHTLEPPWRNNKPFVSSIPPGTYPGRLFRRPNGDLVVELRDVAGRSKILIHIGNRPKDTQGCILPGQTTSKDFVGKSEDAMEDIMRIVRATTNFDQGSGEATDIWVRIR